MFPIAAGWAFGVFIYLKVAFEAASYSGVTVLAALLMAVMFGVVLSVLVSAYAKSIANARVNSYLADKPQPGIIRQTIFPMVVGAVAYAVVCRLIVFGFSSKLNEDIEMFRWRDLNPTFVMFLVVIILPLLVHYITLVMSIKHAANRPDAESAGSDNLGE